MKRQALLALLALLLSPAPASADNSERGQRFLLALRIALQPDERIESFSIDTWGVDILAVCRIPPGWTMKAGRSAAPDGVIEGRSTHGVTWIGPADLGRLNGLALVELRGPIQPRTIRFDPPGSGELPATFAGRAEIAGESGRTLELTAANMGLTPATRCPRPPR